MSQTKRRTEHNRQMVVRIDDDLLRQVREDSERNERFISQTVRRALKIYLAMDEAERRTRSLKT